MNNQHPVADLWSTLFPEVRLADLDGAVLSLDIDGLVDWVGREQVETAELGTQAGQIQIFGVRSQPDFSFIG